LYKASGEETIVTQYSLNYLEDVDLIKFDFLGLKTLDVIDSALKLVKENYKKEINFSTMQMDDQKVFDAICSGHTLGMFQIESGGMQALNSKLRPNSFEDVIAVLALFRPGPMESGMLNDFIERKHGRAEVVYKFPELEPILKPTYGVIVYQEQVIQIVQAIGGFSLGEADIVRRAMGKKKFDVMEKYKDEFAKGAQKLGHDYKEASTYFELIENFAGYGFNKSHSAAYAMITYQTAYLKTYYSAEFMAALLTSEADNMDKIITYIDEIKRLDIEFLPPDINKSFIHFAPIYEENKASIMFGMGAIKGVGKSALSAILNERENGEFKDLADLISRIDPQKVNKKVLESLIKAGALDCFGYTRKSLLNQIEAIVEKVKQSDQMRKSAVNSLFGDSSEMTSVTIDIKNLEEYSLSEILSLEKETLGIYVSGHPLDSYRNELEKIEYTLSSQLEELADGSWVIFVGKIEEIKKKFSKKGNPMANISFMDLHGNIEFMIFESTIKELEKLNLNEPVAIKVLIQKNDQETRKTVKKIMSLDDASKEKVKIKKQEVRHDPITIEIELAENEEVLVKLYEILHKNIGLHKLNILIKAKLQEVFIETNYSCSSEIKKHLNEFSNIKVLELQSA
ncbi:MAG: polymerase subunit alpha, partial [Campylobacterota bacterium]|nr:polymerase subunit alpha [Campylobacterota bacterium]